MAKRIFTGAHLLNYDNSKQFGAIGASYSISNKGERAILSLRKEDLQDFSVEDGFINIELNFKQLEVLANASKSVSEQIGLLVILFERNKLNDTAFIDD